MTCTSSIPFRRGTITVDAPTAPAMSSSAAGIRSAA
jgi:hypothetical protein